MKFSVSGAPVPKGRPRFTRAGYTYTPAKTVAQEEKIRLAFRMAQGKLIDGPLEIHICAVMPIPKSLKIKDRQSLKWHQKRPDVDNIAKTVLDALNGEAYKDDSQIAILNITKIYGNEPQTEISISKIESNVNL